MRVAVFGTYDERAHPRTRVLREGLLDAGVDVAVVNRPLQLSTAERVRMLEEPARIPLLLLQILRCWTLLVIGRLRLRQPVDAVLVGYLGHFDVLLARVLFPRTTIVLDYLVSAADTARDRRFEGSRKVVLLAALDRLACAAADVVLVDTTESLVTVPAAARDRAAVVPVGAPHEWFVQPPEERAPGPLRIVFYGLFTPLQGVPDLTRGLALAAASGLHFEATLIGDGQDRDAAVAHAPSHGITWLDWVPPEELPRLVMSHDVCIGILGDTAKALRVVPNKAYQGAAAGCLVVTADTPPQRRVLPAETVFVSPGDAAGLATALLDLPDPAELLVRRRRSQFAAREGFQPIACARKLLDAMEVRDVS